MQIHKSTNFKYPKNLRVATVMNYVACGSGMLFPCCQNATAAFRLRTAPLDAAATAAAATPMTVPVVAKLLLRS